MSLRVLISGAGVAGLALARQLAAKAIPYTLVEKSMAHRTDGAGIALPANAVAALEYMGLKDEVLKHAHTVSEIIYAKPSGTVLSCASLQKPPFNTNPFVAMRRAKLHEILARDAEATIFNTQVTGIKTINDKVEVDFESEVLQTESFDIVVGADGLNSKVRAQTFGDVSLVEFPIHCWRWICSYPTEGIQPTYQLGSKDVFMTYPIGKNEVYCYAHVVGNNPCLSESNDYGAALTEAFQQYGGLAQRVLTVIPKHKDIIAGQLRSVPQPFFTRGKVALIGDASSACSPMLQQGAACGFEDAVILAEMLANFKPEKALEHYQQYREDRVRWIVTASDTPMRRLTDKSSHLALFLRDLVIRFKGPFNVQGWEKLLAEDPLAALPDYINLHQTAGLKLRYENL